MVNLIDFFGGTLIIFTVAVLEIIVVVWWYGKYLFFITLCSWKHNFPLIVGIENICWDIEFMSKKKVAVYWKICWGLITPTLLLGIFVYFIATTSRLKYGEYDYPDRILGNVL